jgi:hypothetical protein
LPIPNKLRTFSKSRFGELDKSVFLRTAEAAKSLKMLLKIAAKGRDFEQIPSPN